MQLSAWISEDTSRVTSRYISDALNNPTLVRAQPYGSVRSTPLFIGLWLVLHVQGIGVL